MKPLDINTLPDSAETKVRHVYVYCSGIKKRCRSIDYHSFDFGFFSESTDMADLTPFAISFAKTQMKSFSSLKIKIKAINEVIEYKNGMRIIKFSSQDIFNAERIEHRLASTLA